MSSHKRTLSDADEGRFEVKKTTRTAESEGNDSSAEAQSSGRSSSVRENLRQKLLNKQSQSDQESSKVLEECRSHLLANGYACEILGLSSEHSPFPQSTQQQPSAVLAIFASSLHTYAEIGPFHPVRLLVYSDGSWQLQCEIFDHSVIDSGTLTLTNPAELLALAEKWLTPSHTLCPGIIQTSSEVEGTLGYIPKNMRVIGRGVHSSKCKIWHVPSAKRANTAVCDPRWSRVCGECSNSLSYLKTRLQKKKTLDSSKRYNRQQPNSNYGWKFLSPGSKNKRRQNARNQRSRLSKQVAKLYRRTKVEIPGEQSDELCDLIQAIEESECGKKSLEDVKNQGNKVQDKKGVKAGDCVMEVWKKDRDSFFKDQRKNGNY